MTGAGRQSQDAGKPRDTEQGGDLVADATSAFLIIWVLLRARLVVIMVSPCQRLTPACFNRAVVLAEVFPPADAVAAGFLDRVVPAADSGWMILPEVDIEFMVVTDGPRGEFTHLVPMAHRGNAVPTAAGWLIGTSEHGVLGRRCICDGPGDPVLAAQLVALIQGQAVPQAQNVSTTPDPTVIGRPSADIVLTAAGSDVTSNGPSGTNLCGGPVSRTVR
jgi:hypothetical protein